MEANIYIQIGDQCEQIDLPLKRIRDDISYKEAQMFGYFSGNFEKCHILSKKLVATFWPTVDKNWITFNTNIWSHF